MKRGKIINLALVVFWALIMFVLVRRNVPSLRSNQAYLKRVVLEEGEMEKDTWMGVYLGEKKIGYSHLGIVRTTLKEQDVYKVLDETYMKLKYTGQIYDARITSTAYLKKNLIPITFSLNIFTEVYRVNIEGKVKGNKMEVVVDSGGVIFKKTFPISSSTYLPIGLNLLLSKQNLEVGKPYRFNLFDPEMLSGTDYMTVTLKRRERIGNEEVMVVEKNYKNLLTTSWINMRGELLREESPLGLRLLREPREIALKKDRIEAGELVKRASIPSNVFIPAARSLSYIKLRMRGLRGLRPPADYRQSVSEGSGGGVIVEVDARRRPPYKPAVKAARKVSKEYLLPSALIQSNEPEIVNLAVKITEDDTLPWQRAKRLNKWVFENIQKVPTFSLPSAVNVLKEKRGDCNEHVALLVALARAVKIPARTAIGIVYLAPSGLTVGEGDKGSFFYHAWTEVFIQGGWRPLDPILGQDNADASHIKFLDGGIDKQVEIVGLIGNLKVKVEKFK